MDRFEALAAFRSVVDVGGFSAAARHLGVSKAAISSRIARLEQHLGVVLLSRSTRRLSLTEAGRAFYGESVRILDMLADAEADMSAAHAEVRGILRVNAPLSFATRRLLPIVTRYMASNPQVRIDLQLNDGPVDPVGRGFDLTLRIRRRLDDSQMIARRIGRITHVVCAAPDYVDRKGAPLRPRDLLDHSLLAYGDGTSDLVRHAFRAGTEVEELEAAPHLQINNSLAIRQAVLAGAGVAVIPRFAVDDALADQRLTTLLSDYELEPYSLFAILPAGRRTPAKTRGFVECLIAAESVVCD